MKFFQCLTFHLQILSLSVQSGEEAPEPIGVGIQVASGVQRLFGLVQTVNRRQFTA
jgi:hypothetical protein